MTAAKGSDKRQCHRCNAGHQACGAAALGQDFLSDRGEQKGSNVKLNVNDDQHDQLRIHAPWFYHLEKLPCQIVRIMLHN